MRSNKETAAVIGAGVIGLTTALEAQRAGFKRVRIYSENPPLSTTSVKAGAVFEPYEPGDLDVATVNRFVTVGMERYGEIIDDYSEKETGIRMHDLYLASHAPMDPGKYSFLDVLPTTPLYLDSARDRIPGDYSHAIKVEVPMIDPNLALPWLMDRFVNQGGDVAGFQKIENINEFLRNVPERVVFNCSGLGARDLLGDTELTPVRGQIAVARYARPGYDYSVLGDDAFYAFPRQSQVVLGGSIERGQEAEVTTGRINEIIEHAKLIIPDLKNSDIVQTYAGLRPFRASGPRIEIDDRVIGKTHVVNTGFGGSGWTFCFGAAERAVGLVRPHDFEMPVVQAA